MKHPIVPSIIFLSFLFFALTAAQAQNSLYDNANYILSLNYQQRALEAYNSGNFGKSAEYSWQAELHSVTALLESETQRMRWIANSFRNKAAQRIAYGETIDASERYEDLWQKAHVSFAVAESEYSAERYLPSTEASKNVIELLAGIVEKEKDTEEDLPAFYTVRLIESSRDCFWNIAQYSFIYGDPLKWPELYEANKDKLADPGNPNLIHPGLILTIPSLQGETRTGTWSPQSQNGAGQF